VSTLSETNELLDAIAKVLLRCFVLGFLLLLLWTVVFVFLSGPIYAQGKWFGLSPDEVDVIHYCGIAFVKMCVLLFFLFPYISIRLVLRRKSL
jgi:hypothetical protein